MQLSLLRPCLDINNRKPRNVGQCEDPGLSSHYHQRERWEEKKEKRKEEVNRRKWDYIAIFYSDLISPPPPAQDGIIFF